MMLFVVAIVGSATRLVANDEEAPHRISGLLVQELVLHLSADRDEKEAPDPGEILMTVFFANKGRLYRVLLTHADTREGYPPSILTSSLRSKISWRVDLGRPLLPTEKTALASLPEVDWSEIGAQVEDAPAENLVLLTRFSKARPETVITLKDKSPPPLATLHSLMIAKARERLAAPDAAKD